MLEKHLSCEFISLSIYSDPHNREYLYDDDIVKLFDEDILSIKEVSLNTDDRRAFLGLVKAIVKNKDSAIKIIKNYALQVQLIQIIKTAMEQDKFNTHTVLERLFSEEQFYDALFSAGSLECFQASLYSIDDLLKIKDLRYFLTPRGWDALKDKVITVHDIQDIESLRILSTDEGVEFLTAKHITIQQASDLHKNSSGMVWPSTLNSVLSPLGQQCITQGLLTVEDMNQILDLKGVLTSEGVQALRDGSITTKEAKQRRFLSIFHLPNSAKALKEGLVTLDQAEKFHSYARPGTLPKSIRFMLTDEGLKKLTEGKYTPEDAAEFYHSGSVRQNTDHIERLFTGLGQKLIKEKLISVTDLSCCDFEELSKLYDDDASMCVPILNCFRFKLMSLKDFNHPSYVDRNSAFAKAKGNTTKEKITHLQERCTNAAVVIKKYWCKYIDFEQVENGCAN